MPSRMKNNVQNLSGIKWTLFEIYGYSFSIGAGTYEVKASLPNTEAEKNWNFHFSGFMKSDYAKSEKP